MSRNRIGADGRSPTVSMTELMKPARSALSQMLNRPHCAQTSLATCGPQLDPTAPVIEPQQQARGSVTNKPRALVDRVVVDSNKKLS
jgi:hypothetical protein